jgi:hypothetical protein
VLLDGRLGIVALQHLAIGRHMQRLDGHHLAEVVVVTPMVAAKRIDQLLAFVFRVEPLKCLLTHAYFSSPACRRILLSVPMGTSSDILPGTVTLPGLSVCVRG